MAQVRIELELAKTGDLKPVVAIEIDGEIKQLFITSKNRTKNGKYYRSLLLTAGQDYPISWGIVGKDEESLTVTWTHKGLRYAQIVDAIDSSTDRDYPNSRFTRSGWNSLEAPQP